VTVRAVVAVAALIVMAGCGGGTTRAGVSAPPTLSSPSASPTPSGPQPAVPQTVLSAGGTYYPAHFQPRVTFALEDTWWLDGEDRWSMVMTPGASYQSEENVVFINVQRVFDPSNQRKLVPAPKDLVGWFVRHPGFVFLTKPHPVEIGGVRGTEFDVRLGKAPLCPPNPNLPAGTRCLLITPSQPGDPFSPAEAVNGPPLGLFTTPTGSPEHNRFDVLHVHGHQLLIAYGDSPQSFHTTVRLFERLLQTIRFG
jgi:hypothetical protein